MINSSKLADDVCVAWGRRGRKGERMRGEGGGGMRTRRGKGSSRGGGNQ